MTLTKLMFRIPLKLDLSILSEIWDITFCRRRHLLNRLLKMKIRWWAYHMTAQRSWIGTSIWMQRIWTILTDGKSQLTLMLWFLLSRIQQWCSPLGRYGYLTCLYHFLQSQLPWKISLACSFFANWYQNLGD